MKNIARIAKGPILKLLITTGHVKDMLINILKGFIGAVEIAIKMLQAVSLQNTSLQKNMSMKN